MIRVRFSRGTGSAVLPAEAYIIIRTPFFKLRSAQPFVRYETDGQGAGYPPLSYSVSVYNKFFVLRSGSLTAVSGDCFVDWIIEGEFNFDNFEIYSSGYDRRIEVRNENGVLITDNGLPWTNGTYPPDAKNRAGLSGFHAAPTVINPELETALMGDETNKERVQE